MKIFLNHTVQFIYDFVFFFFSIHHLIGFDSTLCFSLLVNLSLYEYGVYKRVFNDFFLLIGNCYAKMPFNVFIV